MTRRTQLAIVITTIKILFKGCSFLYLGVRSAMLLLVMTTSTTASSPVASRASLLIATRGRATATVGASSAGLPQVHVTEKLPPR